MSSSTHTPICHSVLVCACVCTAVAKQRFWANSVWTSVLSDHHFCNKSLSLSFTESCSVPGGISVSQRARYATYFDVAVLRCLMQPHWTEEGVHWALIYYLQRLRQILQEKPERPPEPQIPPLPRPRSSSMVAATPSLVNTHKTQVTIQCQLADSVFYIAVSDGNGLWHNCIRFWWGQNSVIINSF